MTGQTQSEAKRLGLYTSSDNLCHQQPTFLHSGEKEPGQVGVTGKVRAGVPRLGEEQGAGAEEVPAGIRACRSVFV